MNTKPKALQLAESLIENSDLDSAEGGNPDVCKLEWDAAEELKRLHELNKEFLKVMELCRPHMYEHASNTEDDAFDKLCDAIAKAEGGAA